MTARLMPCPEVHSSPPVQSATAPGTGSHVRALAGSAPAPRTAAAERGRWTTVGTELTRSCFWRQLYNFQRSFPPQCNGPTSVCLSPSGTLAPLLHGDWSVGWPARGVMYPAPEQVTEQPSLLKGTRQEAPVCSLSYGPAFPRVCHVNGTIQHVASESWLLSHGGRHLRLTRITAPAFLLPCVASAHGL